MSSPGGLQPAGAPRERDDHAGFDPGGDVWKIVLEKGVTHISFTPIRDHWGDRHADSAKQVALAYMEDRSPDTVRGAVQALARMARRVPVGDIISAATLMDYPKSRSWFQGRSRKSLVGWGHERIETGP